MQPIALRAHDNKGLVLIQRVVGDAFATKLQELFEGVQPVVSIVSVRGRVIIFVSIVGIGVGRGFIRRGGLFIFSCFHGTAAVLQLSQTCCSELLLSVFVKTGRRTRHIKDEDEELGTIRVPQHTHSLQFIRARSVQDAGKVGYADIDAVSEFQGPGVWPSGRKVLGTDPSVGSGHRCHQSGLAPRRVAWGLRHEDETITLENNNGINQIHKTMDTWIQ